MSRHYDSHRLRSAHPTKTTINNVRYIWNHTQGFCHKHDREMSILPDDHQIKELGPGTTALPVGWALGL